MNGFLRLVRRSSLSRSSLPAIRCRGSVRPVSGLWLLTAPARPLATSGRVCCSCASPLTATELICPMCSKIQTVPKSLDYFSLFSLSPSVELDEQELEKIFKRMQRVLHPDKFAQRPEIEQIMALKASSFVNQAYQTLKDRYSRLHYLLALSGAPVSEETVGKMLDQSFLLEIMEKMEFFSMEDPDSGGFREVAEQNDRDIDDCYVAAALCAARRDWSGAQEATSRLNYFQRIRSLIQDRIEQMT